MKSKNSVEANVAWVKMFAAALLCFAAASVPTARAADNAPAPAQTEAQVPGDIQIARWDVILNDNGLESMDSVDNQTVHTTSKIYQGAIFNADALRGAMNAAAALNGLEAGSQSMAFTQSYNNDDNYNMQPLYFNYNFGPTARVGVQGTGHGQETYEKTDDTHLHVKFDYSDLNLWLMIYDPNRGINQDPQDKSASMSYDGQLSPGDALVFSATLKDKAGTSYRHVVVWEAFKAEQHYQQNFQMVRDSVRWCQLGPKWIRHYADVAAVWGSHAKHDPSAVPAKWEQKLEDGKTLKLIGVSRSDKYLYCWWDGDGQPIRNNNGWFSFQTYNKDQPVWFFAEVSGPAEEWKLQTPSGHPGMNQPQRTGPYTDQITAVAEPSGQAIVGVAVGPWEQVGEIKKGGSIKVGAETYTLRNIQSLGGNEIYVNFNPQHGGKQNSPDVVMLSAVLQDGTEVDTNWSRMITARNYGMSSQFQGVTLKTLKTFHVWKRKQQWVTFKDFAAEPATPPNDQITAADLAAAVAVQEKEQQQVQEHAMAQQMASLETKRKEWEAIPVDLTTPKGSLRAMFQSAENGDLKAVRARMIAKQSDAGPMLDTFARFVTVSQLVRTQAIARYGAEKVQGLQTVGAGGMGPPPLMDFEMELAAMQWTPRPDGGIEANGIAVTKGADGNFSLDLSIMKEQAKGLQGVTMMVLVDGISQRLEHINQLMKDDPKFTIDQLRHAITDTTPLPTTQAAATKPAG